MHRRRVVLALALAVMAAALLLPAVALAAPAPAHGSIMLTSVGVNWYASVFSPDVVNYDLTRHDPDYDRVAWARWASRSTTST